MKIFTVFLLSSFYFSHSAQAVNRGPVEPVERTMREALKQVKLSPEQKDKIREIRSIDKERMKTMKMAFEKARDDLDRLLDKSADDEALKNAFNDMQNAKRALDTERFQKILAIRSVLSDEQKSSFQAIRARAISAASSERKPDARNE